MLLRGESDENGHGFEALNDSRVKDDGEIYVNQDLASKCDNIDRYKIAQR